MHEVSIARILSGLAGAAARRPRLTLALALALGVAGAVLALGLRPSAATDTFVARSSSGYRATQRFYRAFGEEPVEVMVKGSLQQLLLSSDVERLVGLEGCLAGKVPARALAHEGGASGPCAQLARLGTVRAVIGPGTFLNEAAEQIDSQLSTRGALAERHAREAQRTISRAALAQGRSAAEARQLGSEASKLTLERYAQEVELLGAEYGLTAAPQLNDPSFVARVVFDNNAKLPGTPKTRFAYLFPSREAALVTVRLRAGLGDSQRARTIAAIRGAVAMPQWQLQHGERYLVTGEPVIVAELTHAITHSLELLLLAVALAMALALALVFRGRPRLLPLAIAALATALTFGALAAFGFALSVAQVAVLPVLVGLAVDYAIQFQSRVEEARRGGRAGADAITHAAGRAAPSIAAAACAAGAALLVLALSPVPTVRGFGLLLVVGLALALLCALTVGSAALALTEGAPASAGAGAGAVDGAALATLRSSWRGARELLRANALTRALSRAALVHAVRHPARVLGIGLALAALGWGLDTQTHVETNLEKLVPQSMAALRNLDALERSSGIGGEIDLMVGGPHVASPATIQWMSEYESRVLRRFGYSATRGCGKAQLCPAFSLPDLFQGGALTGAATGSTTGSAGAASGSGGAASGSGGAAAAGRLTPRAVHALLAAIPPYFSQNVLSADRRTATLAFGIRLMSLQQQQRVIDAMRAALHPPRGVSAQLVGLPVLAAQSATAVASPTRRVLTLLAGLLAAALVLLAAFRGDARRALTPLLPVVLATGWSALVVFALRVPLNPLSVTLSALVIAVSTEFAVLLCERHRQELRAGHDVLEALRRTYAHTGAAIAASGVTAIVGFGVLVLSDIAMLRDFGIVTLVDLGVSLLGVYVATPAALLLLGAPLARGELGGLAGGGLAGRLRRAVWPRRPRARARDEPA